MQEKDCIEQRETYPLLHVTEVPHEGQDKPEEIQSRSKEATALEWSTSAPPAARPICRSRRPQLQARRARTSRAVTRRSRPANTRSPTRHTSSSGRRRLSSLFFRRRRRIGSHSTTKRADRKGRATPMSRHLSLSIPPLDERRRHLLEWKTSHSHCSRPDEPGTVVSEEGGPVVRAGADEAVLPVTAPILGAEGAEPPPQMQEQSCPPSPQPLPGKQIPPGSRKTWRDLAQQAGKLLQHAPQKEEPLEQTIQRQQEPGRQPPSPHPPVAHA